MRHILRRQFSGQEYRWRFNPLWSKSWALGFTFLTLLGVFLAFRIGDSFGFASVPSWLDSWIKNSNLEVKPNRFAQLLGIYVLNVTLSHVIILHILNFVRWLSIMPPPRFRELVAPAVIGAVEAIMFPAVWMMAKPQFIAFWLGFKVAGGWGVWNDPELGRYRFQIFMLGSALNVILSTIAYFFIKAVGILEPN